MNEKKYNYLEIGRIPKEWKLVKLGTIANIETGKRAKGGGLSEGTVASIGGEHIDQDGNILWDKMKFIPENFYENLNQGKVKLGDILMVKDGATTGKTCIVRNLPYEKVAVNEHVFVIRSKAGVINEFLFYVLFSKVGQNQIKLKYHGLIGGIKREDIKSIIIPLPPLCEQQKIAKILLTVDEAIEKVDEAIAKTERLKKGLMLNLLKGIGYKENWKIVRLEEVVEIYDNERVPLNETQRLEMKGKYPYCGANGILDYINDYIFEGEFILLAEDGGYWSKFQQSAYIMSGKFWANNHVHVLKAIDNIASNQFLMYILNYLDLTPYVVGSTRGKLNQKDMRNIKIPLPPLEEQQKIAEILSTVDKRLELLKRKKEKLERVKEGLMNDLLTGRKRVRSEA